MLCVYRPLIFGNIKIVVNKGSGDSIFGMLRIFFYTIYIEIYV